MGTKKEKKEEHENRVNSDNLLNFQKTLENI